MSDVWIFYGIPHDHANFRRDYLAGKERKRDLGCHKDVKVGDRVLIYFQLPVGAIVAKGEVVGEPYKTNMGEPFLYRAPMIVQLLPRYIPLEVLKRKFPKLGSIRGKSKVPDEYAEEIWSMATG